MDSLGNPIDLGRTAEVYTWNEGTILKLFHEWFPLSAIEHEAQVAHAVHEAGLPVPAVGDLIEIDGRYGLVYERVIGVSMLEAQASHPWTLLRCARLLAELQADMHETEAAQGLPAQHQSLRRKIQEAKVLTSDLREAALRMLEELPQGYQLCHGDFHPGNVMMTERGAVVIDWIDATRGNPLADVARSSLLMDMAPLQDGAPHPWILGLGRKWFHRAYLRRYFQLRPENQQDLTAWRLVNAAARLSEGIPEERALLAFARVGLS